MRRKKGVIGIQSMARPKKIDGVSRHGKHAIGVFGVSLCLSAAEELINKDFKIFCGQMVCTHQNIKSEDA